MALCFRFENFDVPAFVSPNVTIRLECSYDLEGEELDSVRWYKDQALIYRYSPHELPENEFFGMFGVFISVSANAVIQNLNYICTTKIE